MEKKTNGSSQGQGDAGDKAKGEQQQEQQRQERGRGRTKRADRVGAVADLLTDAAAGAGGEKGAAKASGDGQKGAGDERQQEKGGDQVRDKQGAEGAKGGQGDAGDQAKEKPKTWKDVAARLGMEPAELYGLALDLSGGKDPMTLGQVKDFLQTHGAAAADVSTLLGEAQTNSAKAREERENATSEANQVRRDLVGILGAMGRVPAPVLEQVRAAQSRRMERELQLTVAAAPEWRDAKTFSQDKAEISAMLGRYGFSSRELDAVDDSRLMLFLRDQLHARRAAARSLNKEQSGEKPGANAARSDPAARGSLSRSQAQGHQARIAAAKAGGRQSKVGAVAALLTGKR